MKEIKYRVYDTRFGFFEVGNIDFVNNCVSYLVDWDHINNEMLDEDYFEVCYTTLDQLIAFTGLTDEAGNEIYEGAFVSFENDIEDVTVEPVSWNSDFGGYTPFCLCGGPMPEDVKVVGSSYSVKE